MTGQFQTNFRQISGKSDAHISEISEEDISQEYFSHLISYKPHTNFKQILGESQAYLWQILYIS